MLYKLNNLYQTVCNAYKEQEGPIDHTPPTRVPVHLPKEVTNC